MSQDTRYWLVTFAIWGVGAYLLSVVWHWHPRNQLLDVIWGFALYIVAFSYALALAWLRPAVERWHRRRMRQ